MKYKAAETILRHSIYYVEDTEDNSRMTDTALATKVPSV